MSQVMETPKPLSCAIEAKKKHATFDREELLRFVQNTNEASFVVEDDDGNQSVILVQPILDFLFS
jgi:hypothetical protein